MIELKKDYTIATVFASVATILIVVILTTLVVYFVVRNIVLAPQNIPNVTTAGAALSAPPVVRNNFVVDDFSTEIIKFSPPANLPLIVQNGECFSSSIAQPYRKDAFRCMADNSVYDPCFKVDGGDSVYCQAGIDGSTGFVMNSKTDLPKWHQPKILQDNWAWYLILKDGTECSPFTGTRPIFDKNMVAYYGCKSKDTSKQIVLLGDIVTGKVWTAKEAILSKKGDGWTTDFINIVKIAKIWQ